MSKKKLEVAKSKTFTKANQVKYENIFDKFTFKLIPIKTEMKLYKPNVSNSLLLSWNLTIIFGYCSIYRSKEGLIVLQPCC